MAYEAFFQVADRLSGDYARRRREDELYERQRADRRSDIADERAYQDRVREETYDRALEQARELADINIAAEVKRIKELGGAELAERAASLGVPVTGVDGVPRARVDVENDIIDAAAAREQRIAINKARAAAEALTDPGVREAQRGAAVAAAQDAAAVSDATRPIRQETQDRENARRAELLQESYDQVTAELESLITASQSDPAVAEGMQIYAKLRDKVLAKLDPAPAIRDEQLKELGFDPTALNNYETLAKQLAPALGVEWDGQAAADAAELRSKGALQAMLAALGDALNRRRSIETSALSDNIRLRPSGSPYSQYFTPTTTDPSTTSGGGAGGSSGVVLPTTGDGSGADVTPAPAPTANTPGWQTVGGVFANTLALPGKAIDQVGRGYEAGRNWFFTGDASLPERGPVTRLGDTLGTGFVKAGEGADALRSYMNTSAEEATRARVEQQRRINERMNANQREAQSWWRQNP